MKPFRSFIFATIIVLIFFVFLETVLRFSGFQPTIRFKQFALPAWMEELDPLVLAKYQSFVVEQGFVNEDAYAYKPDLRYGYLLKPDLKITVSNYSSAIFLDKLPPWKIESDSKGNRISTQGSSVNSISESMTIHVLGDSSSFGWGVNFEDSYPQQLIKILKDSPDFSKAMVKNHSIPGFTSFQGKLLLKDKVEIEKNDIVLVSFGFNDSYTSKSSDRLRFEVRNTIPGKIIWFLNRLLILKGLRTLILSLPDLRISESKFTRVSLKEYQNNLGIIFKTILKEKGKPLFLNICNGQEYSNVAEKTAKTLKVPFLNVPKKFKQHLSQAHNIYPEKFVAYFEVYGELMEKETHLAFLFPDFCHPNAIGHRLIAEILFHKSKVFNSK
tara:strand:- start:116 stop:1267 length:1152 start_codon:yes stop_codon:yes gene_type:complete